MLESCKNKLETICLNADAVFELYKSEKKNAWKYNEDIIFYTFSINPKDIIKKEYASINSHGNLVIKQPIVRHAKLSFHNVEMLPYVSISFLDTSGNSHIKHIGTYEVISKKCA